MDTLSKGMEDDMMKQVIKGVVLFLVGLGFVFGGLINARNTIAALVTVNSDIVFDDINQRYWISNLPIFSDVTYQEALEQIDQLNQDNWNDRSDWHLAKRTELLWYNGYTYDQVGGAFIPTMFTIPSWAMWGGWADKTDEIPNIRARYDIHYMPGENPEWFVKYWELGPDTSDTGAWVTTDVVAIPPAIYLLGSGLVGLVALRRKFQKR